MNHPEQNEQVTKESALAEMRKLATLDVNRILRDVETRRQGLVRAIKARSISVARGFAERVKHGLEEASASAEAIGDNEFPAALRSVAQSVNELEEMIPQGVGKDVSDDDVNGLSALAAGISVPSLYQPKFDVELPAVPEPSTEPESEVSRVEFRVAETPATVLEKTETQPSTPVAPLQSLETPPENPKTEDNAQPAVVGASSKPAKASLSNIMGLGETEEDDNLPPEAAKFADTSKVEKVRRINKHKTDGNGGAKDNTPPVVSKSKLKPTIGVRKGDPRGYEFTNGIDISAAPKKSGSAAEFRGVGEKANDVASFSRGVSRERLVGQERLNREKEAFAPNLGQVITEMNSMIADGKEANLLLAPAAEDEKEKSIEFRIRRMANRFGSINFNKLPAAEREAEITRAVSAFTSNEILRADLLHVFRKSARLEGAVVGPLEETSPVPKSTDAAPVLPEELPELPKVPTLEGVIAEIKRVTKQGGGKGLVSVPVAEVESTIRHMGNRFGSVAFNKLPPADRETEILNDVNEFTSDSNWRAKLEQVFRKMARVEAFVGKLPVTEPLVSESAKSVESAVTPELSPTNVTAEGDRNSNSAVIAGNQTPFFGADNAEVFDVKNPEHLRRGVFFRDFLTTLMKTSEAGLNERIKKWLAQERQSGATEKVPFAPNLEQIITEVSREIARGKGEGLVLMPYKKVEEIGVNVRGMANKFGSINFNKLPAAEREAEIVRAVNAFTSNETLRGDLERVFRKMARIEGALSPLPASTTVGVTTAGIRPESGDGNAQAAFESLVLPPDDKYIGPKNQLTFDAQSITERRNAFKFDDLGSLNPQDLEKILTKAGAPMLARALMPAAYRGKALEAITGPLSEAFKAELLKQIQLLPPQSDSDDATAEANQKSIVEIAKVLEETGAISFQPKAEIASADNAPTEVIAEVDQQTNVIPAKAVLVPVPEVNQTADAILSVNTAATLDTNQAANTVLSKANEAVAPQPPQKETKRQKQDRLAREFRREVFADKREEMKRSQSGSVGGKPPAKPPEVAVGVPSESEPNRDTLELDGTETSEGLLRKISPLALVNFRGERVTGKVLADTVQRVLDFMGTEDFRSLAFDDRKDIIAAFVEDLKTIDPKVAELAFIKQLEEAVALQMPESASEAVREISPEKIVREEQEGTSPVSAPEKMPPRPAASPKPEAVEVQLKMIASPSEALVKAVLEDPAGFDIGKAMDVPGFDEFLVEGEKMGVVIDMADAASLRKRFEAFAFKDIAAERTYELYADSISKDLGLSLDDEGRQAVREHLERQAHVDPESIKNLVDKFERFEKKPAQIAEDERKLNELKATLTPEAQARARGELTVKQEMFAMALKTNQFLPWRPWKGEKLNDEKVGLAGLGRLQSIAGIFFKKSYAGATARKEAGKIATVHSAGLEKWLTLGIGGFSNKELRTSLQLIEGKLAEFENDIETKKMTLAELEAIGQQAKNDLENAKVYLFQDSVLTKKLVGMARVKVKERLQASLTYGEETVEKSVDANELFEKALRASAGGKFGEDADFIETVDVPDYRRLIDAALDRGITKEIEKSIVRSMALSEGRFGELQKAFDKLTAKERLGSKSRAEVRRFIVKKLKHEIGSMAKSNVDDSTEDGKKQAAETKLKTLHLKALVVKQQEALIFNK